MNDLADIDIFTPAHYTDGFPHDLFTRLRSEDPVVLLQGIATTSDLPLCCTTLRPGVISSGSMPSASHASVRIST